MSVQLIVSKEISRRKNCVGKGSEGDARAFY